MFIEQEFVHEHGLFNIKRTFKLFVKGHDTQGGAYSVCRICVIFVLMNLKLKTIGSSPNTKLREQILKAIHHSQPLLKFAYLGMGASAWNTMRQSDDFKVGNRELSVLTEIATHSTKLLRSKKRLNLIHIGPGNGIEIPIFFKAF